MQINIAYMQHKILGVHITCVGLKCWGEISQSGDFLKRCCYQINGMTGAFIKELWDYAVQQQLNRNLNNINLPING